jgi:hypothetical protein
MSIDPIISQGRAYIRLMESAAVLLAGDLGEQEKVIVCQALRLAAERLQALMAEEPPAVIAEILVASDRTMVPVERYSLN